MKNKVFHFVSTNTISGLENMVINIITLVDGYNYTYVSPNGLINKRLDDLGIKHINIKKMTPFYVRKVLKKYNPDIVHGHDVKASISLAINSSICHKKHIKIISEIHNDDPRMHKISLRSILYRISSLYYDKIIVVSNSIIDNYVFHKSIKNKTIVINNVINPLIIKNSTHYMTQYYNSWDCIFIGRFVYQKNPLLFIIVINNLKKYKKNISAVMVGDGPLKQSINDLIDKYDLKDNILLAGFQSNPYQYLNNSKVLLMPSNFEGFGLVALESLILGVPVIASSVGGLKNILNNKCGYLVNSKDEFVNKTYKLLFNDNLYSLKQQNTFFQSNKINNIYKFKNLYKKVYNC